MLALPSLVPVSRSSASAEVALAVSGASSSLPPDGRSGATVGGSLPAPQSLPRKKEVVLWVRLCTTQLSLYQRFLATREVRELMVSTDSPLAALDVLRKICQHPRLLNQRVKEVMKAEAGESPHVQTHKYICMHTCIRTYIRVCVCCCWDAYVCAGCGGGGGVGSNAWGTLPCRTPLVASLLLRLTCATSPTTAAPTEDGFGATVEVVDQAMDFAGPLEPTTLIAHSGKLPVVLKLLTEFKGKFHCAAFCT